MPQSSKKPSGAPGRAVGAAKKTKPQVKAAGKSSKRKSASANIQWHSGFYGAAELEYRSNADKLTYDQEHELGKMPQRVDLLIIKKPRDTVIENETGKIFQSINIIEYKGPDDTLTIDDYYRGLGYGCRYKALGKKVNEYPAEEMTISFFIEDRPKQLLDELKKSGRSIEEKYPGVYYIHGDLTFIHQQIVVLSELDRKANHHAFLILNKKVSPEDVGLFFERTKRFKEPNDRHNIGSVLRVSAVANMDVFSNVKSRRQNSMQDVLRELMKDEFLEAERKAAEEAVKAERAAAQKAATKSAQTAAKKLYATGVSSEVIASALNCKVSTVQKWVGAT